MNQTRTALTVVGQHKITAQHQQRLACIYIRQSTLHQVEHHRESQLNQYQLAQQAEALGWPASQIQVIDSDLGVSGQDWENREGFKALIAQISLGQVGIVFGYEVSRLARNNRDWYHLLDLAALFGTLIADNEGIYDPQSYNDRLLLGLKGTMSEAELHLLKQRMQAGRMSKVLRGEHQQQLPTGLVRLPDGTVVKHPDDQVRHSIELVLDKFSELKSCHQVLHDLQQAEVVLPRRQTFGLQRGEIVWKRPTYSTIYSIVTNPAYAGAFVFGRRQVDPTKRRLGQRRAGLVRQPMSAWTHIEHDRYPAYISWEQYQMNQDQLSQNRSYSPENKEGPQGAVGRGEALLQGIVWCGRCGARMQTRYPDSHWYLCQSLRRTYGEPVCGQLSGPTIDQAVIQAFFEAIEPAKLDALSEILASQDAERKRLEKHWHQRVQRAQYEAQLAQRQYDAVDPDNRLVATELERRWEEKLCQVQAVQDGYEHFKQQARPTQLPPELQDQLRHISQRLPELWPQLSNQHKKDLLRSLVNRVILNRTQPDQVLLKIVWVSGHYSQLNVSMPVRRLEDLSDYEAMIERVNALWQQGLSDQQIADQLTGEGFRSPMDTQQVLPKTVDLIRRKNKWYRTGYHHRHVLEIEGQLTVQGLATQLGVKREWVYSKIRRGKIDASYIRRHSESGVYLFPNDPGFIAQLRTLLPRPNGDEADS